MVEQMRDHGSGIIVTGDIKGFLRKECVGSNATHLKLLSFLTDVEKKAKLQLELAVLIDWGHSFVKAIYSLDENGPLAVNYYKATETVRAAIHSSHIPNVQATVSCSDDIKQQ